MSNSSSKPKSHDLADRLRFIAKYLERPAASAEEIVFSVTVEEAAELVAGLPDETTGRIPAANPQLQAHVTAVADFMQELAPYLGLDDGLVSTRDFIDAARRIREWCHDHQTFPKLEYSEHCGCCARNKITVEVFARPAVEPAGKLPPDSVLDLQLIRAALGRSALALPVLYTLCRRAGLRAGTDAAEKILADIKLAIVEADRFANEVCNNDAQEKNKG